MVRSPPKTSGRKIKVVDYNKTQINPKDCPPPGLYTIKAREQLASGAFIWEIQDGPWKGRTFTGFAPGLPEPKSTVN